MEPAIKIAIGALAISFLNLIGVAINSVFIAKTYRKNKRAEFIQRRDHLSQKISDLNDKNTETQLISARYEIAAVTKAGLPLRGKQAEQNTVLITSIKMLRERVENGIKLSDAYIESLRGKHSNLTLETDSPEVERMITIVQVASDNLRKLNGVHLSSLHIIETTSEITKNILTETDEKIRQINVETDEKIRQINVDFDRAIEKLTVSKTFSKSIGRVRKKGRQLP